MNTTSTENSTARTQWLDPVPEFNQYGEPTGAEIVECADCGVEVLRQYKPTASGGMQPMSCTCDERTQAHDLAAILTNCDTVLGVDVLDPSVRPHTGWRIEATLTRRTVPHTILRVLAFNHAVLEELGTQGKPERARLTVTI